MTDGDRTLLNAIPSAISQLKGGIMEFNFMLEIAKVELQAVRSTCPQCEYQQLAYDKVRFVENLNIPADLKFFNQYITLVAAVHLTYNLSPYNPANN